MLVKVVTTLVALLERLLVLLDVLLMVEVLRLVLAAICRLGRTDPGAKKVLQYLGWQV